MIGKALRDLREDHIFLRDILHRLLAFDLVIDVFLSDNQVAVVVDQHCHKPHIMGTITHHKPIHNGKPILLPQLPQKRLSPQRIRHHRSIFLVNQRKNVALTVAKKVFPGRMQLQLLIARICAVAFIAACLEIDIIYT